MRPDAGRVCQSLMVVSYWMPGSAHCQAASAIWSHRSRALHGPDDAAVGAPAQLPLFVVLDSLDEVVGDAHRVVRVLARDGGVGFAVEVAGVASRDQGGDLLLLFGLPDDELLDVGMVDVEHHHLGGAPGGAATLDRAGRAVEDLEEAHQAGGRAAAGERLALGRGSSRSWCRCRSHT